MKLKLMKIIAMMLLITIPVSSCSKGREGKEYQTINAEEAKVIIDTEENIVILDVRTKAEFDAGYIPNAMLIPDAKLKEEVEMKIPDKDTKILIYCRSGNRSAKSAKLLIEMGYNNVFDFGGILTWPYDIVTD
ncbi:MAG: rhodanese-like domain-containing protein [Clostridiales bacterium]|jgi:rhodanese-related sulfurtransferase|nr:rhodanese-like domain-containing protein [Clostridiales bacterium]